MTQIYIKTSPSSSSPEWGYDVEDRERFLELNAPWVYWYFYPEEDDWHRGPAFRLQEAQDALATQAEASDPDDRW